MTARGAAADALQGAPAHDAARPDRPGEAADIQKLAALGGSADKAPFHSSVADFYFTNPIARSSAVMAECSAIAHGRTAKAAAE